MKVPPPALPSQSPAPMRGPLFVKRFYFGFLEHATLRPAGCLFIHRPRFPASPLLRKGKLNKLNEDAS